MSGRAAAHGPDINAAKKRKYEAKQRRLQAAAASDVNESSTFTRGRWFEGRASYAAHVTVEDIRAIRLARDCNGKSTNDAVVSERHEPSDVRLQQIARWIEPFFDLKDTPTVAIGERRLFVAEGTEPVRMMIQKCHIEPFESTGDGSCEEMPPPPRLVSVLVKPAPFFQDPVNLLREMEVRNLVRSEDPVASPPFNVIVANEDVISEIVGFKSARGALACGLVPAYNNGAHDCLFRCLLGRMSDAAGSKSRRLLALDNVSNTANLGSILRTAAAFGVHAVILSDGCCDAWYRQSVRVSMGHVLTVPIFRVAELRLAILSSGADPEELSDLPRVLRWLRGNGIKCLASVVDVDECGCSKSPIDPPLAALEKFKGAEVDSWCLVLGNEGHGISSEVIQACDERIRIGMSNGVDSFSLPVAAGILLHGICSSNEVVDSSSGHDLHE